MFKNNANVLLTQCEILPKNEITNMLFIFMKFFLQSDRQGALLTQSEILA